MNENMLFCERNRIFTDFIKYSKSNSQLTWKFLKSKKVISHNHIKKKVTVNDFYKGEVSLDW